MINRNFNLIMTVFFNGWMIIGFISFWRIRSLKPIDRLKTTLLSRKILHPNRVIEISRQSTAIHRATDRYKMFWVLIDTWCIKPIMIAFIQDNNAQQSQQYFIAFFHFNENSKQVFAPRDQLAKHS